ncbi:hypothetical protein [Mucilaginibacter gotjawali]|uniref:Uncharacterized protein n=2 Tax=Mucilaginibacter gotjawali TaxID=1550579 RepID=A0A110B4N9_9SPHI|nr:hypothetical protein [Mucilaginibacter gotjawali]MBB3055518.1 hypothetical protein [Mucilaginibacter gotjawali]BAU53202.1 hypothetical protein MgSA37_01369 [Mucilaginibacter gotjawali]
MKIRLTYLTFLSVLLLSMTNLRPHPFFKQYPAYLFKGHKAKPILKSNPLGGMFRTMITDTYYSKDNMKHWRESTGLNFGGHYCFAYWGCGSNCQSAAVVDVKTGLIYDGPTAAGGYEFRSTSRLVIVNPGESASDCAMCATEYWVWNESGKKFIQVH